MHHYLKLTCIFVEIFIWYFVIFIVIIIFFFKFLFLTYLSWYRAGFNQKLIVRIKDSIFKRYLNQRYIFLKNHSSKLIRNLSIDQIYLLVQ